jgi:2-methylisocitrate lyase-like PEP mutase family enzyme
VERVASELAGHRLVFNWVEGGRTPPLPLARVAELGFALAILPITLLLAATGAVRRQLAALGDGASPPTGAQPSFDDLVSLLGVDEVSRLEQRFGTPPPE